MHNPKQPTSPVSAKGQLIVIEGASDGIGKTTQYNLLLEYLGQKFGKTKIVNHHFPTYYSYQGKGVEKYLSGDYGKPDELSPYFINNLYAYDRMIAWQTKLKPEFEKGNIILLDRYTTSSLIYQSALIEGKEEKIRFLDYVNDFEYNKLGIKKPDLVIFLHAPFDLVDNLRASRQTNEGDIKNDIHEHDLDFLKKVYENAIFVAKHLGWTEVDCADSKGKRILSIETIHEKIIDIIEGKQA